MSVTGEASISIFPGEEKIKDNKEANEKFTHLCQPVSAVVYLNGVPYL